MTSNSPREQVRAILLDIEGTTTPIAFVHEVLFSYARIHVADYLGANFNSPETVADIALLRDEHVVDEQQGLNPPALSKETRGAELESLVSYVHWLIDRDRKSSGLKSLQGKIWRQGYLDGSLKSTIFPDVPLAFSRWHGAGLNISIFSSGSTLAQQLLFAHTQSGDLTSYISNYFDTSSGPKTASASYQNISSTLMVLPGEVLFVSDVVKELDAAEEAGMQTLLCVRPGNPPQSSNTHEIVEDFDQLL